MDQHGDTQRAKASTTNEVASDDRLDCWKEIAAYLKRTPRTVQRWEKHEGLPVHRHVHSAASSVSARKHEVDAWLAGRRQPIATFNHARPALCPREKQVRESVPRNLLRQLMPILLDMQNQAEGDGEQSADEPM